MQTLESVIALLEATERKMERKREISRTYRATLANDAQLAARAGHHDPINDVNVIS